MAYPLVKFTATPAAAASVRFDFNVDSGTMKTYPDADAFDLGGVQLEGDPDALSVEYGLRTITFDLVVEGTHAQALAQQAAVARELLRAENWLMYQQDASSNPVWFKTFRAEPGSLSFERVDNARTRNTWVIGVTLHAEPFAYGERVTLGAVTVNNNPASGTNPCSWTTATILGDAPAPCRVQVNPSNSGAMPGYRWMISHAALGAAYTPVFWQIGGSDGWTAGTGTSASTADAAFSGGSYRAVNASFTSMFTRISGNAPSTPTRGRYKVLLRFARTDTSAVWEFAFGQNVGANYIMGDTVTSSDSNQTSSWATWVDLGEFSFPRGVGQVPDDMAATPITPNIALQARQVFGSGTEIRLDCIALIPVDIAGQVQGSTMFTEFTRTGIDSSGGLGVWDSDEEAFWAFNSSSGLYTPMPAIEGGFPTLVPGATNVFHLLQQVNGNDPFFGEDATDSISVSTSVVLSYHPRWLYIGAG